MAGPEAGDALARCVGDPEAFLEGCFGVGPHRWSGGGTFDDVLSLADVDRLLTGAGLRRPAVRLVRDGEVLAPTDYTRTARTGGTRIDDMIDPGRVLDLFATGTTVVLQGLQRWWPAAAAFCRDLELALGHAVQANAYLTPEGAAGLAPHHDTHDVFVLQVAGSKHWVVRHPVVDTPLPRHTSDHDRAAARPVAFATDLGRGDALYLPRGWVHAAAAQRDVSLHLTVGVLATTRHDVLARLVDLAAGEAGFRASLPPGWAFDREAATAAVADVVATLAGWLGRLDPSEVADGMRSRFLAGRAPLLDGLLLDVASLDRIDDDTVVTLRPGTMTTLAVEPASPAWPAWPATGVAGDGDGHDRLCLTLGDRRLVMPAAMEPAVRRLVDGAAHRVGDLADLLDRDSRRVLVRRLVRDGALRTCGAPDG